MPLGATDISMIQVAASGGLSSNNIDLETIYKLYVNRQFIFFILSLMAIKISRPLI